MSMRDWIRPVRFDALDLARRVAAESQMLVWQCLAPRAGLLTSLCETQGYVRARVKSLVRRKVAHVAARGGGLSAQREQQVLALALDLVAAQFTGPMLHGRR